jgi:hypothetical protein
MLEGGKYYKVSVYACQSDKVAAYVSLIKGDENGTIVELVRESIIINDYQKISAEFYAETMGVYELGLVGEVSSSSWNLLIDDFSVEELKVGTPVNLRVEEVTENSVKLTWGGNSEKYEVQVLQTGISVVSMKTDTTNAIFANYFYPTQCFALRRVIL